MSDLNLLPDGTVSFLPHRLNRQPVVVRGLTADELWITVGLTGGAGLIIGMFIAFLFSMIALVPSCALICIVLGIFIGGGSLRKAKRGRPETWLYRQIQWRIQTDYPTLAPFIGGHPLVTRSGKWTTRRTLIRRKNTK